MTTNVSAAAATSYMTRRRAVAAGVILLALLGVAVYFGFFYDKDKGTKKENMQLQRLNLRKQLHCYQDADCPDNTFCDPRGMCVPSELLPQYVEAPVLGRGRGAEGSDVTRVVSV